MAAVTQISGSLAAAQNQNTLALANFNIDFSLIKVSASEEYRVLGTILSQRRRENAEAGPLHRTARKLGALFEDIIPQISELSEAYGKRVTQIVEHSSAKFNSDADYGPFSSHIGLDGTSIYAAATSGSKVIALHLLACVLARTWSGPEATAIWVELVESRKAEIRKNSDPSHLHGMLACTIAEQEITRAQLAAWDASARAWLRSADEVKRFEQTQLQLIIKDSGLSVGASGTTYSSVIDAWTLAMTGLQKLILGIPQNISKASVLVGLLSWHLYPDMNVVEPMAQIKFADGLVKPGGIVTLGLSRDGTFDKGVRWSLALSHLRFYGDPVAVERCIGTNSGRVTLQDIHLIALGSVISSWVDFSDIDLDAAADCFVALGECLSKDECEKEEGLLDDIPWLWMLVAAAQTLNRSTGMEQQRCIDLVEFGRRRGRHFLDYGTGCYVPMFGLTHPRVLARVSRGSTDQGLDSSIAVLRNIASLCEMDRDDCLIRYVANSELHLDDPYDCTYDISYDPRMNAEYTTAIPHQTATVKHHRDGGTVYNETHSYWAYIDSKLEPHDQIYEEILQSEDAYVGTAEHEKTLLKYDLRLQPMFREDVSAFQGCVCTTYCHAIGNRSDACSCRLRGVSCTSLCACVQDFETFTHPPVCRNLRPRLYHLQRTGSCCHLLSTRDSNISESSTLRHIWWNSPPRAIGRRYRNLSEYDEDSEEFITFNNADDIKGLDDRDFDVEYSTSLGGYAVFSFLAGDKSAGLYLSNRAPTQFLRIDIQRLTGYLRSGAINRQDLQEHLQNQGASYRYHRIYPMYPARPYLFVESLHAIASASELYCGWPEATVSIAVTQKPIGLAHWADPYFGLKYENRARKFACIAMLETGVHDLNLHDLEPVLALASGNSIFVAEALIQDPSSMDRFSSSKFVGIRRILGNLDRPGVVMLIPPQQPRIRDSDLSSWKVVQQAPFDGLSINLFKQTSLHLSFTDFELPIALASGAFDPEVTLLEALISVHEGRQWIADLDVLDSFDTVVDPVYLMPSECRESCEGPFDPNILNQKLLTDFGARLRSIGNWDELLCCAENLLPNEIGVVRTYNNWTSRLAAFAVCRRKGFVTTVFPSHRLCRKCCDIICDKQWLDRLNAQSTQKSMPIVFII